MNDWKIGKRFYQNYVLEIACKTHEMLENISDTDCLKILLIKQGTMIIEINNKNLVFSAPCILCLNHQDKVSIISQNTYEAECIFFLPKVINSSLTLENIYEEGIPRSEDTSSYQDKYFFLPFIERTETYMGGINADIFMVQQLSQKFNKLQYEMSVEKDNVWPCRSRSFLIEILIVIQERYSTYMTDSAYIRLNDDVTQIGDILDYLHTNYMNKITIKDLTLQFNLNRNTLNQSFLELTGNTPIAYLIKYRLKIAEKMLTNSLVPIYEICERVGFGEEVNFIRSFKKHYGESPTSFRKKYCLIS